MKKTSIKNRVINALTALENALPDTPPDEKLVEKLDLTSLNRNPSGKLNTVIKQMNFKKRSCIVMSFEDYRNLVRNIIDRDIETEYDLQYGISASRHDKPVNPKTDIFPKLSQLFGVNIVSVHADDEFMAMNVWLVYEEV